MDKKYFAAISLVFDNDEANKIYETLNFSDNALEQIGKFVEHHAVSLIQLENGIVDNMFNDRTDIDIFISKQAKLYIKKTFKNFMDFDNELKGLQRLRTRFLGVPEIYSFNKSELSIVKELIPGINLFLFVKLNPRNSFLYLNIIKLFLVFCQFFIRRVTVVDYTPANIIVHSSTKKLYIIDLETFIEYPSLFNYNFLKRTIYGTFKFFRRFGRLIPRAGRHMR
ncbi:hypothetical protein M8845_03815 [Gelidibacter japonicus]|uniref:hypothetical protein n=1 Tax=Gelidibacter japonicus TaxID=1962232 RepID=UPI0020208A07|nr:hypothetical protein [Gelidibacter japonicus]MCL8006548.1 hypothetical protein [Gelidibacter japonicus]